MTTSSENADWTISESAKLYKIRRWGMGHFSIGPRGTVVARSEGSNRQTCDLAGVVEECVRQGISPPLLLRFTSIIGDRVRKLHDVFARAIEDCGYRGRYRSFYPVKVNQHREVIEAYIKAAGPLGGGLEAGSRAELLAIIAMSDHQMPLLCNGFKDAAIVEMAIRATSFGRQVTIIVDRPQDVGLIIETSRQLNLQPRLGIRVKLAARTSGRWKGSSGNGSKFGLTSVELAIAIQQLRQAGLSDQIRLLHFHPGSQVNSILPIKSCVVEATRIYADLIRQGIPLEAIDVGGGLAIDYTGDKNSSTSSMNYTMQHYANDIVNYMHQICERDSVPQPDIYSESGRSLVAHHSVLVVPVISSWSPAARYGIEHSAAYENGRPSPNPEAPEPLPLVELKEILGELNEQNANEYFHDAQQAIEMAQQLFINGHLTLQQRTVAEDMFARICLQIRDMLEHLNFVPEELKNLKTVFAKTYLANFSLFQALPDHWAIGQLFPVMPVHRLNERPDQQAIIGDITCDSDGKISSYVGSRGAEPCITLHSLVPDKPYWLGIFLIGAYQEALSDDHNLFGKFHTVTIDDSNDWKNGMQSVTGSDLRDVLEHVHHDVEDMLTRIRRDTRRAETDGVLPSGLSQSTIEFFERSITNYTYLSRKPDPIQAPPKRHSAMTDKSGEPAVNQGSRVGL